MAICKFCGVKFAWGNSGEKWVPLVPVGREEGLVCEYQDENGNLRAGHRQICIGYEPGVKIAKLARPILPHEIQPISTARVDLSGCPEIDPPGGDPEEGQHVGDT